jgi:hypothetical protein
MLSGTIACHAAEMLHRYIRIGEMFPRNAAAGLGI